MFAGTVGAAVMTWVEKVERRFTGRPSSSGPSRTLERMLRLAGRLHEQRSVQDAAMRWGTGAFMAALRGVMVQVVERAKWWFVFLRRDQRRGADTRTSVGALSRPGGLTPADSPRRDAPRRSDEMVGGSPAPEELRPAWLAAGRLALWLEGDEVATEEVWHPDVAPYVDPASPDMERLRRAWRTGALANEIQDIGERWARAFLVLDVPAGGARYEAGEPVAACVIHLRWVADAGWRIVHVGSPLTSDELDQLLAGAGG